MRPEYFFHLGTASGWRLACAALFILAKRMRRSNQFLQRIATLVETKKLTNSGIARSPQKWATYKKISIYYLYVTCNG